MRDRPGHKGVHGVKALTLRPLHHLLWRQLPEYHITRTEKQILEAKAAEIIQGASQDLSLVEFGSGNSDKTRL